MNFQKKKENHFIQFQPKKTGYIDYISRIRKIKNIVFCGRLAEYQYYNMDQVVANTLVIIKKILR